MRKLMKTNHLQEAWREGDAEDYPQYGSSAATGGFQALQQNPHRLLTTFAAHFCFREIAHDIRVSSGPVVL
jgi:hypothetical protein